MRPNDFVKCPDFPCSGIRKDRYIIPNIDLDPDTITAIMVSEAPPENQADYFYEPGNGSYSQTTTQAFRDAGMNIMGIQDVLNLGVYVTTAIKCAKTSYSIRPETIQNCSSRILEQEIGLFPRAEPILLMGDTAIKAMNFLVEKNTGRRIIPSGPTYKIRKNNYHYHQIRVYPSYLQTGKSYLIEKSKRKLIAEDIKAALKHG